jgi:predicted metalloprotease with PDZ domain
LADAPTLLSWFDGNINSNENDPGRFYQSLTESSYYTWEDGPFGGRGGAEDKSVSYYEKGPVVGLLLDFAIRSATENRMSLDDVMRHVYQKYYRKLQRGFTDAEFQQACESVAGTSLTELFEYVYTTKEPDYNKYLGYAGLMLEKQPTGSGGTDTRATFKLVHQTNSGSGQSAIFESWLGE